MSDKESIDRQMELHIKEAEEDRIAVSKLPDHFLSSSLIEMIVGNSCIRPNSPGTINFKNVSLKGLRKKLLKSFIEFQRYLKTESNDAE